MTTVAKEERKTTVIHLSAGCYLVACICSPGRGMQDDSKMEGWLKLRIKKLITIMSFFINSNESGRIVV